VKILFLVPYPLNEAPSQRFRFEQYFNDLKDEGHSIRVQSFLGSQNWREFFKMGRPALKVFLLLKGFLKRLWILFFIANYDFIFIHREITPLGPPVFEWIIGKVFRKKMIYDFDDAIWLTDRKKESFLLRIGKWRGKVASICKWSSKISVGNPYLSVFAKQYNQQVVVNPTTIDTRTLHLPGNLKLESEITLGWTGSHSTLKYLHMLEPVLQAIEQEFPNTRLIVIADQKPDLKLSTLRFIPWNLATEIQDLNMIDIGLMPLPDDEWAKGKCGFKILQYMALEIPSVASPVGINTELIQNGVSGFLCGPPEEWHTSLKVLIKDQSLRKMIGKRGRRYVDQYYSNASNRRNFINLFA
jgi:glycosyltransferase involved in cell wall biosynthesis